MTAYVPVSARNSSEASQPGQALHVVCEGTPTDLNVMIRGDAAVELGDYLENQLWNDDTSKVFSSETADARLALCSKWAKVLDGKDGPATFDKTYRELTSSVMEHLRI